MSLEGPGPASPRATAAVKVAALLLPFALLPWLVPFASDLTLGNDYQAFAIDNQLELMLGIELGTYPLFVPGFAGGQSAAAMPQAEVLHPHAHLARLLPGYWQGRALDWNTLLRLLELGVASLLLVGLLLELELEPLEALVVAAVTVFNLRMLDLFRFSAALEAWTGQLFLVVAIGWLALRPGRRLPWLGVVGATYWLGCGGKTQIVLYAFLAAGLFALVLPFALDSLRPQSAGGLRRAARLLLETSGGVAVGLLLSSAFILPFAFDFLPSNVERVGADYAWVTEHQDTLVGTVNNLVLPLRSEVHGAFGGSPLFLVALLAPLLAVAGRLPRALWATAGLAVLLLLLMLGSASPVHRLLFAVAPFPAALRCPGRFSQLLLPLLALLLVWVLRAPPLALHNRRWGSVTVEPRALLAGLAALASAAWVGLVVPRATSAGPRFTPPAIHPLPPWLESAALAGGLVALAALALSRSGGRPRRAAGLLLLLSTLAAAALVLRWGTWVEPRRATATLADMLAAKRTRVDAQDQMPGFGLASAEVLRQARESFLEPDLARLYHRARVVPDLDHAYRVMAADRRPDEVVLVAPAPEPPPAARAPAPTEDRVELVYSSFNRLVLAVSSSAPGHLGLNYPWSGRWRAWVDGRPVPVVAANGAANALPVPAGSSSVEVRYSSLASTVGMVASCATLAALLAGVAASALGGWRRAAAVALALAAGAGLLAVWHRSLYGGASFGTEYRWAPEPPERLANLAYGRPTRPSCASLAVLYPYLRASSSAVDGDRRPGSGFVSCLEPRPWWEIDLTRPTPVGRMLLHEPPDPAFNLRPLEVATSADGLSWRRLAVSGTGSPVEVLLDPSLPTRLVRVTAGGTCRLFLDEVELFPPPADSRILGPRAPAARR